MGEVGGGWGLDAGIATSRRQPALSLEFYLI